MRRGVVIGILPLLLAACSSAAQSESTVPSQSATATAIASEPAPSAEPLTLDLAWSEVGFEGWVGAAIGDGGQFVAVSADPTSRVAWTSADGLSWQSAPVPNPAPTGCNFPEETECFPNTAGMGQLVRLGDTLYSIGTTATFNDYLAPVGWRLTDGQDWAAIQSESEFYGQGSVLDLTASASALVAIKLTGLAGDSGMWRWTFDTSWVESDLSYSPDAPIKVRDVTWGGTFVAVGATLEPIPDVSSEEWPATAAVWASADGSTWSVAAAPVAATDLCSVTATSLGFVALGSTASGPALWISQDAASWTQTDLALPNGATPDLHVFAQSCAVVELDSGLLTTRGFEQGTATWTSVDGTTWEEGPMLDVASGPDLIAAVGDTILIFGRAPGPLANGVPTSLLLMGTLEP